MPQEQHNVGETLDYDVCFGISFFWSQSSNCFLFLWFSTYLQLMLSFEILVDIHRHEVVLPLPSQLGCEPVTPTLIAKKVGLHATIKLLDLVELGIRGGLLQDSLGRRRRKPVGRALIWPSHDDCTAGLT